jgi:hypothetical protein
MLEDQLKVIRSADRISANDMINGLMTNFIELHGDRVTADDHALVGGIGLFSGTTGDHPGCEPWPKSAGTAAVQRWYGQ